MCRAILFQKKKLQMTFQCVSDNSLLRSCRRRLESTSTCAALRLPKGDARSLWNYLSSPHRFPSIAGLEPPLWVKEGDFVRERRRQGGQNPRSCLGRQEDGPLGDLWLSESTWKLRKPCPSAQWDLEFLLSALVHGTNQEDHVCGMFLKSSSNFQYS